MRIAVFSDTHDRYPPGLPERLKDADELWHLGDVCDPETLAEFQALGPPLHVVQGNCDAHGTWPLELELEREGVFFYLTHIPPDRPPRGFAGVLHGHTHVPRDEVIAFARSLLASAGCTEAQDEPSGNGGADDFQESIHDEARLRRQARYYLYGPERWT